jgi:hypothetical protein
MKGKGDWWAISFCAPPVFFGSPILCFLRAFVTDIALATSVAAILSSPAFRCVLCTALCETHRFLRRFSRKIRLRFW